MADLFRFFFGAFYERKSTFSVERDLFWTAYNPVYIVDQLEKQTELTSILDKAQGWPTIQEYQIDRRPYMTWYKPTDTIGVFIDTFIILNLTAFVVIGSGVCFEHVDPATGETIAAGALTGAALAQAGFRSVYGSFGNIFIAVALTFFAFSTVIGWYYFAEQNVKYVFGSREKGINPVVLKVFGLLVAICVFGGAYVVMLSGGAATAVNDIWNLQDALNGLMVIPNLLGILALTGVAVKLLKDNKEKFGLK